MYVKNSGNVILYLLLYVDDIIISSNNIKALDQLKDILCKEFKIEYMGHTNQFLGMNISRDSEHGILQIDQRHYIDKLLKRFFMNDCKEIGTPMETKLTLLKDEQITTKPYRELIDCLMYLATHSRPDISYAVIFLSRSQSKPSDTHWMYLKGILRYLKGTSSLCLTFSRIECDILVSFCDADFAGDLEDRRSTTGYVFKVHGSPVSWCSRKQTTVALSTTEAEYVALSAAVSECLWIRGLLSEMGVILEESTTIFEDNQSTISLLREPRKHQRLKHIDIKYNFIRESIDNKEVNVTYIQSNQQLADIFTKPLPNSRFMELTSKLGLV